MSSIQKTGIVAGNSLNLPGFAAGFPNVRFYAKYTGRSLRCGNAARRNLCGDARKSGRYRDRFKDNDIRAVRLEIVSRIGALWE